MLQCKNLSVSSILEDVSFHAPHGSFTALLGKNGSGKSTLLSCLAAQRKFSGTVTVGTENLLTLSPADRAKRIALLPQIFPTPPLTVYELVCIGRNPHRPFGHVLRTEDRCVVEQSLMQTGIQTLSDRNLRTLSGGERQRAFLAMVLAQDADVLLLDEPTTYMDIHAEAEFAVLLRTLADAGKTLIVVLHDLNLAAKFSDRILENGKLIFCGEKSDCLSAGVIEKAFSVRCSVADGETVFLI